MINTQDKIYDLMKTIYGEIDQRTIKRSWNKFIGDYFVRTIRYYLTKEISDAFQVTEPNGFISGIPIEFDLLIVDRAAKPELHTNSFNGSNVLIGFELKAHGVFGGKEDLSRTLLKIKDGFDEVREKHSCINFIYLTFKEVTETVKDSSINYFADTKKHLNPYKAFCLSDSRRGVIIPGQWEEFIKEINRLCSFRSVVSNSNKVLLSR